MKCKCCIAVVGLAAVVSSFAFAQNTKDPKANPRTAPPATASQTKTSPPAAGEHALPPGMTEADAKAWAEASTPGENHAHLAKGVGVWSGKNKMWMSSEQAEPMLSECTTKVTSMMDGRYTKCETEGDMGEMGPFSGFGLYGYDNVAKTFQSTWIDNCGTGMMVGTGNLSSDGKTMTWNFTYNCPITKKPCPVREVERYTGKDTMTLEMYMTDPKTGKEFKSMEIAYTRKPGTTATATGSER